MGTGTDTIPLYDGEPLGAVIVPLDQQDQEAAQGVRGKRTTPRRSCDRVYICFSPQHESGRIEHVACPVVNISALGVAIEFDEQVKLGLTGHVAYRTVSHKPVRIACRVRRCTPMDNGRFELGLQLNRALRAEELKPAKLGPGRELAPGVRPRQLRDSDDEMPPPTPAD